ncbi:MAG: hypothetical protein A2427_03235 [Candidatus Nealsonbacteria bacterium RIFOXYC1_FULL_40_7]|uniref:Putative pre-16S rRNA nuclease n=1 Tax=Candidatus Nealsonbacteria bacterium RIFOXYC1_FULL_40_7 TaxID=1801678 RepID=A0A1G2EQF5_9BACT|nr:MAG: hypothetical protein A2427_03235 [Candidatus Nealsonbacteria bacterium RIFOXYC1_FULL_40_7]
MTNILGIDLGERKTGVAMCVGKLAEPLMVVRHNSEIELIEKLTVLAKEEEIEEIIVGVSEGEMGRRQRAFGQKLETETSVPVKYWDETLSTKDAQRMSIEAGKGRKKRREMEDAYAATVMLQAWVDENI